MSYPSDKREASFLGVQVVIVSHGMCRSHPPQRANAAYGSLKFPPFIFCPLDHKTVPWASKRDFLFRDDTEL